LAREFIFENKNPLIQADRFFFALFGLDFIEKIRSNWASFSQKI